MITHWVFGKRVLDNLKNDSAMPNILREEFLLGSQGPDILFFHRLLPWLPGRALKGFGNAIHDDVPSKFFEALLDSTCEPQQPHYDAAMSYALGMCCHYALDSAAHPYVNWCVDYLADNDPRGRKFKYHGEIESMLDIMTLRQYENSTTSELDLKECFPQGENTRETVARIYEYIIERLYGVSISSRQALQLTGDARAVAAFLSDRTLVKRPVIEFAENILSPYGLPGGIVSAYMRSLTEKLNFDYGNVCNNQWYNPQSPDETSSESFYEIFERALENAVKICCAFADAAGGMRVDFAALTEERSFSYGCAGAFDA